jgi:hypothetical protein
MWRQFSALFILIFSLERTIYQCLSEFLAPHSFRSLEKFYHSQQPLVLIITVLHKEHVRRKIIKRRVFFCSYFSFAYAGVVVRKNSRCDQRCLMVVYITMKRERVQQDGYR